MSGRIYKIKTTTQDVFIVGHKLDGAEDSPIIVDIELVAGVDEFGIPVMYCVRYSNGTEVEVYDRVQVWREDEIPSAPLSEEI